MVPGICFSIIQSKSGKLITALEQFLALPNFSSKEQLDQSSFSPTTTPSPLMHLFDCTWE